MHARSGTARGRGITRTPRRNNHGPFSSSPMPMGDHVVWRGRDVDSSGSSGSKNASSSSREEAVLEGIAIKQHGSKDGSSSGDSSVQQKATTERGTRPTEGNSSTSRIQEERDILCRPELETLRNMPYEELVDVLPKDNEGKPGSIGSIFHFAHEPDSMCNPCAFMTRSRGCKQGIYCGFCHFPHGGEMKVDEIRKNRPPKAQRMRFRKTVDRLKSQVEENPEKFNADYVRFPPSIEEDTEKKEEVKAILKDHQLQTIALNVVDKYNEDKATQSISL